MIAGISGGPLTTRPPLARLASIINLPERGFGRETH